ncbi:MAG: putative group 1 glycosyl transferase, partial [Fibrobacteres bacterium]|nr:putative group 1 glycosyl transferase [Fibrobacterota bacterium]
LPEIARSRGKRLCLTLHDFWMMCQRVHFYIEPEHKMCSGPDSADKCARCLQGSAWTGLSQLDRERTESLVNRRVAHSKQCMEMMDVVIAPSRYLADKFAAYGFSPSRGIEVCALGLKPVARMESAPARAAGPVRFGFLGTIHPLKNVHLLAGAFAKVAGSASLSFHGMGKQEHIDSLVSDVSQDPRMRYAGKYGPDDLSRILSGLDVVIVCSITENYPLVVREALSAGVPVLASRVGGIPEIIEDGVTGLLFEPERPGELTACIQSLVDNPGRVAAFKAAIGSVKTMDEEAKEWSARYGILADTIHRPRFGAGVGDQAIRMNQKPLPPSK